MARSVKDKFLKELVDSLAKDGEAALHLAYETKDYISRTYNLHDSYGSAVYVNGNIQLHTRRYLGSAMAQRGREGGLWQGQRTKYKQRGLGGDGRYEHGDAITMNGRAEIDRFFTDYGRFVSGQKGIQLVIVATMFYAKILEDGGGRLHRKYRVISGATSVMKHLQRKYNGKLYMLSIGRRYDQDTSQAFDINGIIPI